MAKGQLERPHTRFMRFDPACDLENLGSRLPRFLELAGGDRWWKRANQLVAEAESSPYREKIVADYHWFEMELSTQLAVLQKHGQLLPEGSPCHVNGSFDVRCYGSRHIRSAV